MRICNLRKNLSLLTVAFILVCEGKAEEFDVWTSKSGSSSQGVLHSVDNGSRTIVLLIPKTVSFDDLSAESLKMAHQRASTLKPAKPISTTGDLATQPDNSSETDPRVATIKRLHKELLQIRSQPEFKNSGFRSRSDWIDFYDDILKLMKSSDYRDRKGIFLATTLWQLADEYQETLGQENKFTRLFDARLEQFYRLGEPGPPLFFRQFE